MRSLVLLLLSLPLLQAAPLVPAAQRTSPFDLEISGPLTHGASNAFFTRAQLLSLPLVTATNSPDPAIKATAVYRGIPLSQLATHLPVAPGTDIVFAICTDGYAAHFNRDYIQAFNPLLILEINGQGPEDWGRSLASGVALAPFYINSTGFTPRSSHRIAGLDEGAIYPYAVARLHFTTAAQTVDRLAPPPNAPALALDGHRLAVRDCLSCHGHQSFGGMHSNRPWLLLKTWASNTNYFRRYVIKPKSVQPASRMPGFTHYNEEALDALQAYFKSWKPSP
jgi:mono/diheme cytochrome c family protein